MQVLRFPPGPLASRLQGQREQRQHAEQSFVWPVSAMETTFWESASGSATVQLCFIVMGMRRMGTVAAASPNLCLAALSYHLELEHNT